MEKMTNMHVLGIEVLILHILKGGAKFYKHTLHEE